ncbi:MAG: hypothetical protein AABW99_00335 [archaeon]
MKRDSKKIVKFCSRCGSTDLKPLYFMEAIDNRMQCMGCNVIEFPVEGTEKFRKEFLEGSKNAGK